MLLAGLPFSLCVFQDQRRAAKMGPRMRGIRRRRSIARIYCSTSCFRAMAVQLQVLDANELAGMPALGCRIGHEVHCSVWVNSCRRCVVQHSCG